MKTLKMLTVSLLAVPFFAFGQTQPVVLPAAGMTPESPFYFLDRIGENLRQFFTFNPEAKARLQLEFATERIAEIKAMAEERGIHTKGIDEAKSLLLANVALAADIVNQEKASGQEVKGFVKELDDEFNAREKLLTQTFLEARTKLIAEHMDVRTKLLKDAIAAGDKARIAELTKQLSDLKDEAQSLQDQKDEIKTSFRDEKKKLEDNLDLKDLEESKINQEKQDQEELGQQGEQDEAELDQEGDQGENEIGQIGEQGQSDQNEHEGQGATSTEQSGIND